MKYERHCGPPPPGVEIEFLSRRRQGSARELRVKLERRVAGLRDKLDRLEDAFLFRHQIDQQSYEHQRDRMRQQRALAELDLADAAEEQLDLEGLLGFAEHVLGNARAL